MFEGMTGSVHSTAFLILLVGGVIAASVALRAILDRTHVPAMVGFVALGFMLRLADGRWDILSAHGEFAFEFLAELGVIALLFRVGLESDLARLRRQLPRAAIIWAGNVGLSGALGYLAMRLLGFALIPSLIAATALTATSIGVSVGMWRRRNALRTTKGEMLIDVAEMDDLSAVVLMAALFSVLPVLRAGAAGEGASLSTAEAGAGGSGGGAGDLLLAILSTGGFVALKLVLFSALCYAFARLAEKRLTSLFTRLATPPELMVLVVGIGIVIAGFAAWLEFSAAIGALFAGLAFSRDPQAIRIEAGFRGLYHLLTPFFFIGIGLALETDALGSALGVGAALILVAVVGKVLGAGLPALMITGAAGATLIGVSMVPRAEIAMIIMQRGRQLGDWAVSADLYAAFVLVSAVTCVLAPVALEFLFRRWPAEIAGAGQPRSEGAVNLGHRRDSA